jgi:hypothetical protein
MKDNNYQPMNIINTIFYKLIKRSICGDDIVGILSNPTINSFSHMNLQSMDDYMYSNPLSLYL